MNEDGTNEITIDVISLTGANEKAYGFALDDDEERVFFHDQTTRSLRSIDYDLTIGSFTTWPLTLTNNDWGDIDYSQGFIFYGGIDPSSGGYNNKMYRFELSTGERLEIGGINQSIRGGYEGTVDVFIHRDRNELWLAGESRPTFITPTNFDFYTQYMIEDAVNLGTLDISWTPVDGATSYNLLQDGVVVATTSQTSYSLTDLGTDNTKYKFTLESSADGITYTKVPYYKKIFVARDRVWTQEALSTTNWPSVETCLGVVDPYDPQEFVITRSGKVYGYNVETDTLRVLAPFGISASENLVSTRGWTNKRFYYVPNSQNTDIYDLGVECNKLLGFSSESEFLAETSNRIFSGTEQIRSLTSRFEESELYYGTSTGIRKVNLNGTNDSSVLTTTSFVRGIGIDPYNPSTIVYSSGNHIWHHDLSTSVTTQITATNLHGNTHDLEVLDGTIYGQYYNRPFDYGLFSLETDGSNLFEVETISINGSSQWTLGKRFLTDHANKKITTIDRSFSKTIVYDANMGVLPSDPSLLLIRASPIGLDVTWSPVEGAVLYGVSYSVGEDGVSDQIVGSQSIPSDVFRYRISSLSPSQTYTVYLFYTTVQGSSPNILVTSKTLQTLTGSGGASDFDSSFFQKGDGVENNEFDLTTLSRSNLSLVSDVLNELFETGDSIDIPVNGRKISTKLVRRGESAAVEDGLSLAIPFSTSSGANQSATLTLSDNSTVDVEFDETTESIVVAGVSYSSGENFVLDGKKVTIFDI